MTRLSILFATVLALALPAFAENEPWYTTKVSIARKSLGTVTLNVNPGSLHCYVDSTWEQGQLDFVALDRLAATDSEHTNWSHYVEGEGFCDTLLPPFEKELVDSSITLDVTAETWFVATYYGDGHCDFTAHEEVKGTHPTLGEFDDRKELFEMKLTTETCKQAFAPWPKN